MILEVTLRNGPAVDGVTGRRTVTIDSIDCATHHRMLAVIRDIAETPSPALREREGQVARATRG